MLSRVVDRLRRHLIAVEAGKCSGTASALLDGLRAPDNVLERAAGSPDDRPAYFDSIALTLDDGDAKRPSRDYAYCKMKAVG